MIVVNTTVAAMAGSSPSRAKPIGTRAPASPATIILTTIAAAITMPSTGPENQKAAIKPTRSANKTPLKAPTINSFITVR